MISDSELTDIYRRLERLTWADDRDMHEASAKYILVNDLPALLTSLHEAQAELKKKDAILKEVRRL